MRIIIILLSKIGSSSICFQLLFLLSLLPQYQCLSSPKSSVVVSSKIDLIKSQIPQNPDATIVPLTIFDEASKNSAVEFTYSSDIVEGESISFKDYVEYTSQRHRDCVELFDRYETRTLRCEALQSDSSFNLRWQASWVPSRSLWLYELSEKVGWNIERVVINPYRIATFSWKAVIKVFNNAFKTGNITLPIMNAKGSTRFVLVDNNDENKDLLILSSIEESIDLVRDADLYRLQNRRVAQELASWLDVSRRPPTYGEDDWAALVRERIINDVPGAGPFDIDPNEDSAVPFVAFSIISVFVFSYFFLLGEVQIQTTETISQVCSDAAKIEVGDGYLTECYGPYGDGSLLK